MNYSSIRARRYARALFKLADSNGNCKEIRDDLIKVNAVYDSLPEMFSRIQHPFIIKDKGISIMEVFNLHLNTIVNELIILLAKRKKTTLIPEITTAFKEYIDRKERIRRVEIVAAHEITEQDKERLKHKLHNFLYGGKIIINEIYNKDLIGGLLIKWDDKQLDLSMNYQLKSIQEQLEEIMIKQDVKISDS